MECSHPEVRSQVRSQVRAIGERAYGPYLPNKSQLLAYFKGPSLEDSVGVSVINAYFSAPGSFGPDNSIVVANNYITADNQRLSTPAFSSNMTSTGLADGFALLESTASAYRAFWQLTSTSPLSAGRRYAVRVTVRNVSGAITDMLTHAGGTGTFTRVDSFANAAADGTTSAVILCMIFDCTASGTLAIRFGARCSAAGGTHPVSMEIGQAAISEIAIDSSLPVPYVFPSGGNIISTAHSVAESNGVLTESFSGDGNYHGQSSVMVLSDSFGNDTTDWPNVLRNNLHNTHAIYSNGISGRTLLQIVSDALAQLDLSAYTVSGAYTYLPFPDYVARPGMAIIGAGINDISGLATLQDMVDRFHAVSTVCFAAGVTRILWFDLPPFKGLATWTQAKEDVRQAWNTAIAALVATDSRLELFRISEVLGDTDPLYLNSTYDSGDGLHPNATGHLAIEAAVRKYVQRLFSFGDNATMRAVDTAVGGDVLFDSTDSMAPFERNYDEWFALDAINNPADGRFNIGRKGIPMYGSDQVDDDYIRVQRAIGNY